MSKVASAWSKSKAGSKQPVEFPVVARPGGSSVVIPVLAARGVKDGPTLLVTAGVHGDEFEGMAAIRQVFAELEPRRMRGTFIGVPVANVPAYEAGLRSSADDRLDLARVFPGDPHGTVTEQIAAVLTERFIRHANLFCDLHSAGQYYAIQPVVGYSLVPGAQLDAQRAAARVFGLDLVWGTAPNRGRSLSAAADCGVPAIYAEMCGEGRCRPADVEAYVHGIRQLLKHLGIVPGPPERHRPKWIVEDDRPDAGYLQIQHRAAVGGFFRSHVELWQPVRSGDVLGEILNPAGRALDTVRSRFTGRVLFLRTFPRVHAGDALCTIIETDCSPVGR